MVLVVALSQQQVGFLERQRSTLEYTEPCRTDIPICIDPVTIRLAFIGQSLEAEPFEHTFDVNCCALPPRVSVPHFGVTRSASYHCPGLLA